MPVMMIGAACAANVVDDYVIAADRDLAVTSGAAVELAGDRANQPRLVALVGEPAKAGASIGKAVESTHRDRSG